MQKGFKYLQMYEHIYMCICIYIYDDGILNKIFQRLWYEIKKYRFIYHEFNYIIMYV
jgi:hypothetical protein